MGVGSHLQRQLDTRETLAGAITPSIMTQTSQVAWGKQDLAVPNAGPSWHAMLAPLLPLSCFLFLNRKGSLWHGLQSGFWYRIAAQIG